MKLKIKVLRKDKNVELPKIIDKGEWIDLRASETVTMDTPQASTLKKHTVNGIGTSYREVKFDFKLIPLGVAMKLPEGFEAVVLPRSSTYKKHGIIMSNSQGIIDNSYSGNNDEWKFPAIAMTDTIICKGDRICQFRIQLSQKATIWQKIKWMFSNGIKIVEVDSLSRTDRNGFGSTGIN